MTDEWQYYLDALEGRFGDVPKGRVATGFYRRRRQVKTRVEHQEVGGSRTNARTAWDAVALYRIAVHDGEDLVCLMNGHLVDAPEDELAERIFASCCRHPITKEAYDRFIETGEWPEGIVGEIEAAAAERGIGDNAGLPHEIARDELEAIDLAYTRWLAEIGGAVTVEDQDAKAESFLKRTRAFETDSDKKRAADKKPYLDKCREIDGNWNPLVRQAETLKRRIASDLTPFRQERGRQQREAERLAREQAAKAAVPMAAPRPRTGLRTFRSVALDDLNAAVAHLLTLPEARAELQQTVEKIVRRMLEAKAPVPGARLVEEQRAA